MDYLEHNRKIPRHEPMTKIEREVSVEQKKCKTCKHYDFYSCRIRNARAAPDMICPFPVELYSPSELFKPTNKSDSEEEASVL